ncbi:hypothetical protein [Bergeyella sp. RCAD1439]|uniref:hypothetical protein n=1 Tax=Bergeyella anatis TaxID=3113737 RepID=UPI002E16B6C5|nr:hypothetical protein [Bergeyella sp. RCAD1439]
MTDNRILALIQHPEQILKEDLSLLETQIRQYPYAQSLRALHLLAVKRFGSSEEYQKKLTETAAYTTDKKILYLFLNKEKESAHTVTESPSIAENETQASENTPIATENIPLNEVKIPSDTEKTEEKEEVKPKLEDRPLESVAEETAPPPKKEEKPAPEALSEKESPAGLNFHQSTDFLPKVVPSTKFPQENYVPKQNTSNRHEEEMKRLIAEVEAKIKARKEKEKEKTTSNASATNEDKTDESSEISFAQTQAFVVTPTPEEEKPRPTSSEASNVQSSPDTPTPSSWKPMRIASVKPDSKIELPVVKEPVPGTAIEKTEKNTPKETTAATEKDDRPVFNVSFFSEQVVKIEPEEPQISSEKALPDAKPKPKSNIPHFINTWQKWLRQENAPKEEPPVSVRKETIIEKFIENEPKITKRKEEESTFVVKEKTDDISHLMTETLANLYLSQKLYTKAVKAFEVLQEKHPDRAAEFGERIEEIKALRQNK